MRKSRMTVSIIAAVAFGAAIVSYPILNDDGMVLPDEVRKHHLFTTYEANYAYKPLMGSVADLNGDGLSDILVVYSLNRESNRIVAILDGETPVITPEEPAPLENVAIEFKDIDKTPPTEFIISGNKGSHFGFGIYRIQEGSIFNIFNADMEDCC